MPPALDEVPPELRAPPVALPDCAVLPPNAFAPPVGPEPPTIGPPPAGVEPPRAVAPPFGAEPPTPFESGGLLLPLQPIIVNALVTRRLNFGRSDIRGTFSE